MIEGVVIKGYGGFYFVYTPEGLWRCSLRGRIRHRGEQVLVGDRVLVRPAGDGVGTVEEVLPRKTRLVRPPVANVDQVVIVMAAAEPEADLYLLDRLLVVVGATGLEAAICVNKVDLVAAGGPSWVEVYRRAAYSVVTTSTVTRTGLDRLVDLLAGKVSVLAGPSGVGKSSLLNALVPGLALKTGGISRKLGRGRHVTRHVELLVLPQHGLVADTPGFSSLYLPALKREQVSELFPEMEAHRGRCRFAVCLHYREPECGVRQAVAEGKIAPWRYEHYVRFLEEVMAEERRYD
jgi:ribosome biogenesis GTPase